MQCTLFLLTVLGGQLLMHVLECFHDRAVIAAIEWRFDTPTGRRLNRSWHFWDAATWVVVHALIAFVCGHVVFLLTGLAFRWLLLQVLLNHLRGYHLTYLSLSSPVDQWTRRLLPQWWSVRVKVLLCVILIWYAATLCA